MKEKSRNKLLQIKRREGYREMVGEQNRADRRPPMSELWGGRRHSRSHRVPVHEDQKD